MLHLGCITYIGYQLVSHTHDLYVEVIRCPLRQLGATDIIINNNSLIQMHYSYVQYSKDLIISNIS